MIILGKPESDHLDWSQHRLYINNDTGFINEMQSYSYDKCNQMVFDLVKEKMETFEPKPFEKEMTFLKSMGEHTEIPHFLNKDDFDYYLNEFTRGGMRGPINWYRNIDRNWEMTKDTHEKKISPLSCFIVGEDDPVAKWTLINPSLHENLVSSHIIKSAGHWVQQEKPEEVNKLLLDFFK